MSKVAETKGTLQYFKKYRWKDLNKRTINGTQSHRLSRPSNVTYRRKQIKLLISKEEFKSFCDANKDLIMEIYASEDVPSIDRIDNDGHYSIENIRILPLSLNRARVIKMKK